MFGHAIESVAHRERRRGARVADASNVVDLTALLAKSLERRKAPAAKVEKPQTTTKTVSKTAAKAAVRGTPKLAAKRA